MRVSVCLSVGVGELCKMVELEMSFEGRLLLNLTLDGVQIAMGRGILRRTCRPIVKYADCRSGSVAMMRPCAKLLWMLVLLVVFL